MKNLLTNIVLTLAITFLFNTETTAQRARVNGPAYVQVGMGLGGGIGVGGSQTPYLNATFQKTIMENLGPGNLSIGGTVNAKRITASLYNVSYFSLSGRANYHPHFIKIDKLDAYSGVSVGYHTAHFNSKLDEYEDLSNTSHGVTLSAHIGARYQITDKIGSWVEFRSGQGLVNVGASYAL